MMLMLRSAVLEGDLHNKWQPVRFPEESYAIADLADFWAGDDQPPGVRDQRYGTGRARRRSPKRIQALRRSGWRGAGHSERLEPPAWKTPAADGGQPGHGVGPCQQHQGECPAARRADERRHVHAGGRSHVILSRNARLRSAPLQLLQDMVSGWG